MTSEIIKCDLRVQIISRVTVDTPPLVWGFLISFLTSESAQDLLCSEIPSTVLSCCCIINKPLSFLSFLPTLSVRCDPDLRLAPACMEDIWTIIREVLEIPRRSWCSVDKGWGSPLFWTTQPEKVLLQDPTLTEWV